MVSKRAVAALFLSQLLAGVVFAQTAVVPADSQPGITSSIEWGRVSGGEIQLITKHSRRLSGSFGIGLSRSQRPLGMTGSGTNKSYQATVGGTILDDRMWFFATALQNDAVVSQRFASTIPQTVATRGTDVDLRAQLGDRQNLSASFATGRDLAADSSMSVAAPIPTSFLSLHYTGIVSSNMFFTANVSRSSVTPPPLSFAPATQ